MVIYKDYTTIRNKTLKNVISVCINPYPANVENMVSSQ